MAIQKEITLDEFLEFIQQPENAGRAFEFIAGEIVEVAASFMPSIYAAEILRLVGNHAAAQSPRPGYVTGADGGYIMPDGQKYNPDVGYISKVRLLKRPEPGGESPIPPDFAVEVVSPSDLQHRRIRIEKKRQTYIEAKIPLLWYVFPHRKEVDVYAYGVHIRTAGIEDILDGGDVLPGFTMTVSSIFYED